MFWLLFALYVVFFLLKNAFCLDSYLLLLSIIQLAQPQIILQHHRQKQPQPPQPPQFDPQIQIYQPFLRQNFSKRRYNGFLINFFEMLEFIYSNTYIHTSKQPQEKKIHQHTNFLLIFLLFFNFVYLKKIVLFHCAIMSDFNERRYIRCYAFTKKK